MSHFILRSLVLVLAASVTSCVTHRQTDIIVVPAAKPVEKAIERKPIPSPKPQTPVESATSFQPESRID